MSWYDFSSVHSWADIVLVVDSYYPSDKPDTRVSPLLATSLDGLAPAYVQVAGSDILRDEGIAYAEALQDAKYDIPTA